MARRLVWPPSTHGDRRANQAIHYATTDFANRLWRRQGVPKTRNASNGKMDMPFDDVGHVGPWREVRRKFHTIAAYGAAVFG